MSLKKQTIFNIIFSYLGVVVGFVTQAFLVPIFLKPEENGLLGVLMAYTYIFIQLGSLGFNAGGNKFFSHFRDEENGHKGFLFVGILISTLGTTFILGVFYLLFNFTNLIGNGNVNDSQLTSTLLFQSYNWVIIPLTFGMVFFNLLDNYSKNLYETTFGTFLSQFLQRFLQLVAVVIFALGWVDFSQFIIIWVVSMVFYVIPMFWWIGRMKGFSLKPDFSFFRSKFKKEFYVYSMIAILTGFSSMVIQYIDKIMIFDMVGAEKTGVYNTAMYFISVIGISLISMNKAAIPIISNALHTKDYKLLDTVYSKSCISQLILGTLIFLLIIVNYELLFTEINDGYYLLGKWVVIIFGFGKLFDLATGLNGTIVALSKYYYYDIYIMVCLVVITIGLNYFLIPMFGINGAAIVALIATVFYNSARFLLLYRKMKLQPFNRKFLIVLGIGISLFFLVNYIPTPPGLPFGNYIMILVKSSFLLVTYSFLILQLKLFPDLDFHILKEKITAFRKTGKFS